MSQNDDKTSLDIFSKTISKDYIDELVKKIEISTAFFSSNNLYKILNESTKNKLGNYMSRWIEMVENDFSKITVLIKNIPANYRDYVKDDQKFIRLTEDDIIINTAKVNNIVPIIFNHRVLLKLTTDLKDILSQIKYKSRKKIISHLKSNKEFNKISYNFEKIYNILYSFYNKDGCYISYATKNKNRYQIKFEKNSAGVIKAEIQEIQIVDDLFHKNLKNLPLITLDYLQNLAIVDTGIKFFDELFQIAESLKN